MTIREVKQKWIEEVNSVLARHHVVLKDTSAMLVYDATHEKGMSKKLWLCGECADGRNLYFYMYVTKRNELKKYNGTVYATSQSGFEADTAKYNFLEKVL